MKTVGNVTFGLLAIFFIALLMPLMHAMGGYFTG